MQKPDVDSIDGLSPAISIEQKTTSQEPALHRRHGDRDLRLHAPALRARGRPLLARPPGCRSRARPSARWSTGSWSCPRAPACCCWRPSCAAARASTARSFRTSKRGYQRVKIDGEMYEIDEAPALNKKLKHDIEVVVDRIVVREGFGNRLADSLETALGLADGLAFAENADSGERDHLSPRSSPARSAASRSRRSSRGCSRSTILSAPARPATGWARSCISTP